MMNRSLITADCHIAPPPALATELPERMRQFVPRVENRPGGSFFFRPDPTVEPKTPGEERSQNRRSQLVEGVKIDPDDEAQIARLVYANVVPAARPAFTARGLLDDLGRDGVGAAVLINRAVVGAGAGAEVERAWATVVNDWAYDTYKDDLDHLAPGICLPISDVAASVAELERAAALGLRPAVLPDVVPDRPYVDPAWEPLWEAAESLRVPLTVHIGGFRTPKWTRDTTHRFGQGQTTSFALTSLGMAETAAWFACSGVLERHPGLKVVLTECFAGWLAWVMEFYDRHYFGRFGNEYLTEQGYSPMKATEAPPSYYIKRQISCTFTDDPMALRNRDVTGLDCLMWGNDYPHWEGIFPDSLAWIEKQFVDIPEAEVQQIVYDNAASVFGLTV